ncbi:uncharacterized protein LOC142340139 isoform X2 [Convolutriloba macropyga]|uniref:uncharacterized protein LOC142340139 isoform X2 n=1 Tax=Convolutriloba macropyga TaxID=536237 RepID=UPI003F522C66
MRIRISSISAFLVVFFGLAKGLDLRCMNEIETSDGECFYKRKCCAKFASDACRDELSKYDASAPRVHFLDNSLSFDRKRDMLCVHGIASPPVGEKMDDLHGFEFHARKEDARSGVQDTTRTTFMFSNPLTGPVTRDSNPLGDLLMCMPLGKKINSISPGGTVFISLQMIPLKPEKGENPIEYPGYQYLHLLDTPEIKRRGRCELVSVKRVPYKPEMVIESPVTVPVNGQVLGNKSRGNILTSNNGGSSNNASGQTETNANWFVKNWTAITMTATFLLLLALFVAGITFAALKCIKSKKRNIRRQDHQVANPDALVHYPHPLFIPYPTAENQNLGNERAAHNSTRENKRTIRPITHRAGTVSIAGFNDDQPMYHVLDRSDSGTTSHQYCDIDYDAMTSVRPAERTAEDEVEMMEFSRCKNKRSKLRVELTPPDSSTTRTGRDENDIEDNQQTTRDDNNEDGPSNVTSSV